MSTNPFDLLAIEEAEPSRPAPAKVFADPGLFLILLFSLQPQILLLLPRTTELWPRVRKSVTKLPQPGHLANAILSVNLIVKVVCCYSILITCTGRSYELKRGGAGKFNVGTDSDLVEENLAPETQTETIPSPPIESLTLEEEQPVPKRSLEDYFNELNSSVTVAQPRGKTAHAVDLGECIHSPNMDDEESEASDEESEKKRQGKFKDVTSEFANWFKAPRPSRGGRGRGGFRGSRGGHREQREESQQ
ncbi:hypothetical protein GEMRC1_003552 [Eukaryota sp. GEM-RC1]